jgi:hypothetical protein
MTSSGFLLTFGEKDVMTYQSFNTATGKLKKGIRGGADGVLITPPSFGAFEQSVGDE